MTLRVEECWAGYQSHEPVIRGLTGSFESGSLCAVVGPNGCGKTTLLRVLAGLLPPTKGVVTLQDRSVDTWNRQDRAKSLAFVPQRSGAPLGYTASEMVEMGARAAAPGMSDTFRRACVRDALSQTDALATADKPFAALSAGQQQRVTIARALAQLGDVVEGRTLLADEPTAWLDPPHAVRTLEMLRELARRGACVVCVLHDLALARRYADAALLLGPGGEAIAWDVADVALRSDRLESAFSARFVDAATPVGSVPIALANTAPKDEPTIKG